MFNKSFVTKEDLKIFKTPVVFKTPVELIDNLSVSVPDTDDFTIKSPL